MDAGRGEIVGSRSSMDGDDEVHMYINEKKMEILPYIKREKLSVR